MKNICIFGDILNANYKPKGGGELQIYLLANLLSKNGNIIFVLDNKSSEDRQINENFMFISIKKRSKRYVPKIITISKILKEVKCEILYTRITGYSHIVPLILSKFHNIKHYHGLASDLDVENVNLRIKYYYKYKSFLFNLTRGLLIEIVRYFIIHFSDCLIVQNNYQKQKLDKLNIKNYKIRNIVEFESQIIKKKDDYFITVGSFDLRKGFRNIYNIIINLKGTKFILIGGIRDKKTKGLIIELTVLPNVIYLGKLPRKDTINYIAKAKALINTSFIEGFPNIFLEAWSFGTPVLSLFVDPDKLIQRLNFGKFFNGDLNKMIKYIDNYEDHYDKSSMIEYINNNHTEKVIKKKILKIFNIN